MNRNLTVHAGSYTFILCPEDPYRRGYAKKVRVYAPDVTPEMDQPPYGRKGDNLADDAAWRKYNKEELRLMRVELQLAAEAARAEGEVRDEVIFDKIVTALEGKLSFSRKAGCSCPCSPGFVGEHPILLPGIGYLNQISVGRRAVDQPSRKDWEAALEEARTYTMADFDLATA